MKVGVVGAGLMGAEIALVIASNGFDVMLSDVDEAAPSRARDRLAAVLDKGVARGFHTPEQREQSLARAATTDLLKQRVAAGFAGGHDRSGWIAQGG